MGTLDEEKKFYDRFWNLLRDEQLMQVFRKYGPEGFRRSSVLEGFETFIQAQRFGGGRCIEIGTLKGLTAIVLARYFESVVSIDIVDDPLKHVIAQELGVRNVVYLTVRNNAEKADLMRDIAFDAAYVDGDHTHDTEFDFDLVKHCGRVLFHEFWDAQPPVVKLVQSLGNVVTQGKFALWTA